MVTKTLGTVLFVLGLFISNGVTGLKVSSLVNFLRGCFFAVLVLLSNDLTVVDEFALVV